MTLKQCIRILKSFNKWRRRADIKQPNPTKIGEAIDYAVKYMETRR